MEKRLSTRQTSKRRLSFIAAFLLCMETNSKVGETKVYPHLLMMLKAWNMKKGP